MPFNRQHEQKSWWNAADCVFRARRAGYGEFSAPYGSTYRVNRAARKWRAVACTVAERVSPLTLA